MVFFTCNNCGESVKKPAVEKHYQQRKCGGNQINLSCMDCLKDFHGQEYAAHTKCVTELEKYSGKNYVAKVKTNSNEKKQEDWTEIVRSILVKTEYQLSHGARNAFKKLQEFENVPRKKAKFLNFVTKCARISPNFVNECWSVLEKELEIIKQAKQQEIETLKLKKQQEAAAKDIAKNSATINGEIDDKELNTKKSKKEKKHKSKEQQEEITQQNGHCIDEGTEKNAEILVKKMSKKEKKLKQPEETLKLNGYVATTAANDEVDKTVKKSKKQKKSIQQEVATAENGNSIEVDKVNDVEILAKKSKKDKKSKQMNDIEHKVINLKRESTIENSEHFDEIPPAKKSKKNKNLTAQTEIESENNIDEPMKATDKVENTFHWVKTIEKLVKKANATSTEDEIGISIENLKEKLLKKYTTKLDIETLTNKQQKQFGKKFNKYLTKSPTLKIEGDIVKCC